MTSLVRRHGRDLARFRLGAPVRRGRGRPDLRGGAGDLGTETETDEQSAGQKKRYVFEPCYFDVLFYVLFVIFCNP